MKATVALLSCFFICHVTAFRIIDWSKVAMPAPSYKVDLDQPPIKRSCLINFVFIIHLFMFVNCFSLEYTHYYFFIFYSITKFITGRWQHIAKNYDGQRISKWINDTIK